MPKSKTKKADQKNKLLKPAVKDALFYLTEKLLIIIVLFLTSVNINVFFNNHFNVLGASTEVIYNDKTILESDLLFWQQVVEANPTYRDGYLELADIYEKLGNLEKSEKYRNTARRIDPN